VNLAGCSFVSGDVGSDDGNLHALTVPDGAERWPCSFPDYVQTDPVVVDGTVLAGSD
jgi:outer membrane protein assembly factor BamB